MAAGTFSFTVQATTAKGEEKTYKAETVEGLVSVRAALPAPCALLALIETARGVRDVAALCDSRLIDRLVEKLRSDSKIEIVTAAHPFANEAEAHIAQAVLDASGIDSSLIRDDAGGMMPWLQWLHPIRLVVSEEDSVAAVEILDTPPGPTLIS